MKKCYLILILSLFGCQSSDLPIDEIANIKPKNPKWLITKFDESILLPDTIGIDTITITIIVPIDYNLLATTPPEDKLNHNIYLNSKNAMGVCPPLYDINSSQSDTVYSSSGSIAIWHYKPENKLASRFTILNKDTVGVNHYILDSIYYAAANRPQKTGITEGDSTIWTKYYSWVLEKRCIGYKHGLWQHWNSNGELIEETLWDCGKPIKNTP